MDNRDVLLDPNFFRLGRYMLEDMSATAIADRLELTESEIADRWSLCRTWLCDRLSERLGKDVGPHEISAHMVLTLTLLVDQEARIKRDQLFSHEETIDASENVAPEKAPRPPQPAPSTKPDEDETSRYA